MRLAEDRPPCGRRHLITQLPAGFDGEQLITVTNPHDHGNVHGLLESHLSTGWDSHEAECVSEDEQRVVAFDHSLPCVSDHRFAWTHERTEQYLQLLNH